VREAGMSEPAIEAHELSKRFRVGDEDVQALRKVSFRVQPSAVTGLIGPDGAGKTTFMRLAAGLLVPDEGGIRAMGVDATSEARAVQSRLGYMPQRFGLYEDLSVQENLDLYADLHGVSPESRPERYRALMRMTDLGQFTSRLAGRLSGGMKQKLGVACTLVGSPRLLLLDEPTVGVDPVSRRELWEIIYRLVREEGTTVLLSTAYLDEAERCKDVILLHNGQVLDQGPPEQTRNRARGQVFGVTARGRRNRDLQTKLAGQPGIVDAVLHGQRVRVVASEEAVNAVKARLADDELRIEPIAPRFEDGVMLLLREHTRARPREEGPEEASAVARRDDNVIEVRGLSRRFGNFYAVRDVSFGVKRGEVFGLLGANGAGKSTTFRMLCGLLPASAGSLRVAGFDLRTAAAIARARIGYMSQRFSLYANLSVRQNIEFFASVYGLADDRRASRIDWALEEFELEPFAGRLSGELSLGYKQRLAMACALMHEPEILFLDEPTSGVDPIARREFWARINALARAGVTVMVTTHFMEEAEYCDRLAIMVAGRILSMGEPSEIRDRARSREMPEPTLEDAFINVIEHAGKLEAAA
jgi:drug efflux transport system ATP-binding protein